MNQDIEIFEDSLLSPYAIKNKDHEGRIYNEPSDPYRTNFQRDRDRIIHSKSFRRLGYKTQVFVNSRGDNYRTRLTHSLEVSQLSRSIANVLRLNKDFSEVVALAHDLGHPPYGHAGQEILNEIMKEYGGFEHNKQSVRIVTYLEERYPLWKGLNLTRAVIKSLMKYNQVYDEDKHLYELVKEKESQSPPLEFRLVDLCDRLAYIHHDIEDGIDSSLLDYEEILKINYWKELDNYCKKNYGNEYIKSRLPYKVRILIRHSLNFFITDLIQNSKKNLENLQLKSIEEVYALDKKNNPIRNSQSFEEVSKEIYIFLHEKLYQHPEVIVVSIKAKRIIEFLFFEYFKYPSLMPFHIQKRIEEFPLPRIICDYISGMTDRYILLKYNEIA